MTYGYCRVSTKYQSLHRQIDALLDYGVNERFLKIEMKAKYIQNELNISKQCYYDYISMLKVKYYDEF